MKTFCKEMLKKNVKGRETMSQATVLFEEAEELKPRLKAVLKECGKDLASIKTEDIALLWHNGTPRYAAKIGKPPKYYSALGMKPLILIIHRDVWNEFGQGKRNLLLFHELLHVINNDEGGYKLIKHDIEDFKMLLEKYGLAWEKADKDFVHVYTDE